MIKSSNNIFHVLNKEKNKLDDNIQNIFDIQNLEIVKFISDKESERKKLLKENKAILKESILLYKIIMSIIQKYISIFDNIMDIKNSIKLYSHEIFKYLEEFDNIINDAKKNINTYSFPITINKIEQEINSNMLKGNSTNIFKIDSDVKLINNLPYGDLLLKYKKSLDLIEELKNENKNIYEKNKKLNGLKEQNKKNILDKEKSDIQFDNILDSKNLYNIFNLYKKDNHNNEFLNLKSKDNNLFRNKSFIMKEKRNTLNKSKSAIYDKNTIQNNSMINDRNKINKRISKFYNNIRNKDRPKTLRILKKTISSSSIV